MAKPVVADDLRLKDLGDALAAGWADFREHPVFGLFFAAIYVGVGLGLYFGVNSLGEVAWLIPIIAGFPIVAPFIAVGLYEVSRRRERHLPMEWKPILGALNGRGDEQIILMGGLVFVAFSFWVIIAHAISLIFLPNAGMGADIVTTLLSPAGLAMLGMGGVTGGLLAWGLFSVTVVSLPMLIDRDVDCITAIIASISMVRSNLFVMLVWGALVVIVLVIAMLPALIGLFIALPVLGHATWHLYRRAVHMP
ncbi:DUF2189 domain-containing protein [Altererythrobacter aestiaquae]|uniref:DUF2189 domain-containing protein n=2 Tax=Pontixanthobacter aestiaquae TaxID=1509367 RepID=A0A844Z882_9SPHN|nr:DUF2189 domain-containing protein [Pontixanthobacter aestiaquae]